MTGVGHFCGQTILQDLKGNKPMNVKLLVMDVDGTLTDGKIYMGAQGEAIKAFHVRDGYGIHDLLPKYEITPVINTGRVSPMVENRAKELGITEVYQGKADKLSILEGVLAEKGLSFAYVAYMGDDLNDLSCMEKCAIVGCPGDAVSQVRNLSSFIAPHNGGEGAVRDFIDWLISHRH